MAEYEGRFNPEDERGGAVNISEAYNSMEPNEFWEYVNEMPRETKIFFEADVADVPPDVVKRLSTRFSTAEITLYCDSEITQLERNMFSPNVKLVRRP